VNRANFSLGHWTTTIDGLAQKVEDTPEGGFANWNSHRSTRVGYYHSTSQSVGAAQGNATNTGTTQLLLNFTRKLNVNAFHEALYLEGVVNFGKVTAWELGVECRTNHLNNTPGTGRFHGRCHFKSSS
jgi:hypothetical protein